MTDPTLADACAAVQDLMLTITGIQSAPDYPVADAGAYPYCLCYPSRGGIDVTTMGGGWDANDTLTLDFHGSDSANFTNAISQSMTYLDQIIDKLATAGLLGDCALNGVDWTLGKLAPWEDIGVRFLLRVKRLR